MVRSEWVWFKSLFLNILYHFPVWLEQNHARHKPFLQLLWNQHFSSVRWYFSLVLLFRHVADMFAGECVMYVFVCVCACNCEDTTLQVWSWEQQGSCWWHIAALMVLNSVCTNSHFSDYNGNHFYSKTLHPNDLNVELHTTYWPYTNALSLFSIIIITFVTSNSTCSTIPCLS